MLCENIGIPFMTPEIFASYDHNSIFQGKSIPIIPAMKDLVDKLENNDKYFNPFTFYSEQEQDTQRKEEYLKNKKEIMHQLQNIIKNGKSFLIMMVGSPASTKSSLADQIIGNLTKDKNKHHSSTVKLSYDQFDGSKILFKKEFAKAITNKMNIIVDNTNKSASEREKWIKPAKDAKYEIIAIHLDFPKPVIMHLNDMRNKDITVTTTLGNTPNHSNIPDVAIHTYFKNFEPIDINKENMDHLYQITYLDLSEKCYREKFLTF